MSEDSEPTGRFWRGWLQHVTASVLRTLIPLKLNLTSRCHSLYVLDTTRAMSVLNIRLAL